MKISLTRPVIDLNNALYIHKCSVFPAPTSSGALRRIRLSMDESARPGWHDGRAGYMCWDRTHVHVRHRTANARDLDETKTLPANIITYTASKRDAKTIVSGVAFGRDLKTIFGGPDDIRTMIFPEMVRTVRQGSFHCIKSLRFVVLNEGLETLGTERRSHDKPIFYGVFQ